MLEWCGGVFLTVCAFVVAGEERRAGNTKKAEWYAFIGWIALFGVVGVAVYQMYLGDQSLRNWGD